MTTPITTESIDSPPTISTCWTEKDPFQVDDDEDKEENEGNNEDAREEIDVLLPDATGQEPRFSGSLDGVDVASLFKQLFSVLKSKKVYIKNTDEAL